MKTDPENQPEFDMQAVVDSMTWVIAADREVEGGMAKVKIASPSQDFWTAWSSAKTKVKEAGLSASKNDEGAWIVEWISDCADSPVLPRVEPAVAGHASQVEVDTVANLPLGPTTAALSETHSDDVDRAREKIEMVRTDFFSPNPHSTNLYSQVVSPALRESVAKEGVKVPVRSLRNGRLIDGWQRVESSKDGRWEYVPTIFMDIRPEDELQWILLFNAQRIKSIPDRLREYRAYLKVERAKAPERIGIRTDLDQALPEGHIQFGKAHELAAEKVLLSGTSARNGLRVLEEIERRSDSKNAEAALKILTERGISPAWKFAYELGWIDSAVKEKKQKGPKTYDGNTESTANMLDENPVSSSEDKSEAELTVGGWLTDDVINGVITDVAPPDAEEADELRKTISFLRPRLYAVAATTPDASVITKLRATARVLEALATKYAELAAKAPPITG